MADSHTAARGGADPPKTEDADELRIDWAAIEAEPEFQELVHARRAFVIPGTIFFLSWYMGFIVLTAVAPDFMGERVYEGLTVGYVLALTQFLMVLVLGIMYLRKSESTFDPLAEKAIARYVEEHPDDVPGRPGSRFDTKSDAPTTKPAAIR
jgi:uncharacterized membrane protein (DUF485 family)